MKVVLTGGGTAGHAIPAIEIGKYLRRKYLCEIIYIGNEEYIEKSLAEKDKIPFYSISSQGMEGSKLSFVKRNVEGVFEAVKLLKKIKPDFILATGGFVTAPVLAAAIFLKIPYAIHEQNRIMGKVNKLFSNKATFLFSTFPVEENEQIRFSGIPIRFKKKIKKSGDSLVIIGGSGGSVALNEFAINFAKKHPEIKLIIIAGEKNKEKVEKQLEGLEHVKVIGYTDSIYTYYEQAKMVVARSGAGTIFELSRLAIPSILVPLPNSANDHQKENALYFSNQHAAVLIEQTEDFEENLEKTIEELWNDEEKREKMRKNIENLSKSSCEKEVSNTIIQYLELIKK